MRGLSFGEDDPNPLARVIETPAGRDDLERSAEMPSLSPAPPPRLLLSHDDQGKSNEDRDDGSPKWLLSKCCGTMGFIAPELCGAGNESPMPYDGMLADVRPFWPSLPTLARVSLDPPPPPPPSAHALPDVRSFWSSLPNACS